MGDLLCLVLPLVATIVAVGVTVFLRPDMLAVSTSLSHVADEGKILNNSQSGDQYKTAQDDKELKPVAWIDDEIVNAVTEHNVLFFSLGGRGGGGNLNLAHVTVDMFHEDCI